MDRQQLIKELTVGMTRAEVERLLGRPDAMTGTLCPEGLSLGYGGDDMKLHWLHFHGDGPEAALHDWWEA
jgi:hypothetical protein